MFDILTGIWDFITGIISFVSDLITSLINIFHLLADSIQWLEGMFFLIPGELLIFGAVFLYIFILNRMTSGSNSGGD